ncbi:hypothetical protein AHAS_Ahas16G0255200 [Arachis hypogaea]
MTFIVTFLADIGAPFRINAYPYFAYRNNPTNFDYALFGNAPVFTIQKATSTATCWTRRSML